jgi:AraC family chitin signaling transcriptional activator
LNAFEKINKNFRIKLNKKSNQILTHTELKICSFIKIGFDNYEIAGLLSIGLRGVQQHRYRIKKKMGLKSQKLDYIISNIN